MTKKSLKAIRQGILKIGERELECAVLENGARIISRNAIFRALGRTKRGRARDETRVPNMPSFMDAKNLQPFISEELRGGLKPIEYQDINEKLTAGYDANILPLICDAYLMAREAGVLTKRQLPLAVVCEILIRSFSSIALIDEATGYQEIRSRLALEEILEKFISEELRKWAKTFPDDFYKEMFRLRGWQYIPLSVKRPSVVGHLTNDIVYKRLAPGVLDELKRITPKDEKGHRKHRYFQRLTEEVGHPRLREHLTAVIALMKAARGWGQFYRSLQRALPQYNVTLDLPLPTDENEKENN